MTQEDLARKLGTGMSYISRMEAGLLDIRVSTCERIAEALDYPVWVLMREAFYRREPEAR